MSVRNRNMNEAPLQENSPRASKWLTSSLFILLLILIVTLSVFLGGRQYVLLGHYDKISAMHVEVKALQFSVQQETENLEVILKDPFRTEKMARERMNYCLPGELIFRFQTTE